MTSAQEQSVSRLLESGFDPEPVEILNQGSSSGLLLVCEHAGTAIPRSLSNLGLPDERFQQHIASDIGAEAVAVGLAERFGCTLVLQRYSRLVIDCNRPTGTPQSIPEISDHISVPGNFELSSTDRVQRETEIFVPFAESCKAEISRPHIRLAVSIHSFTPQLDGDLRRWDIGFLSRQETSRGDRLAKSCKELWPRLTVGRNEPYRIEDETDWFIPVCAEPRNIAHCLIEIRNDHLLAVNGQNLWVDRLYGLISKFLEQPNDS